MPMLFTIVSVVQDLALVVVAVVLIAVVDVISALTKLERGASERARNRFPIDEYAHQTIRPSSIIVVK